MPVLSRTRHVACDGAFNLRDLGGYPTADGRSVRWQVLYRADGLHRIPASTTSSLEHLGWRTVLDLRTSGEVDAGAFRAAGIEVIHLPVLRATWGVPEVTDVEPVAFLSTHYLRMLDEGAGAIAAAFEILASPARLPAVFHCSAGKDRTGVVAALVLAVLGVPDDVIAADYHLSATAVEQLVAWLVATQPDRREEMARQPKAFLSCPPEAMLTFLDELRLRHGSVEAYLTAIGVAPASLDRLRDSLLEPG
ncbi:MAG: tyrosine-protein phosphatase [Actinomycetota bacterium]|nr:tyrosine-protein phosphatase [Actinomycetota bacterium]